MIYKKIECEKSKELRKLGNSLDAIAKELCVDKHSVMKWVKGIECPPKKLQTKEEKLAKKRAWYANNSEKQKFWTIDRERRLYEWYYNLKQTLKCERCEESFFACLDFHHKNPDEKEFNIASLLQKGWSKERILKEIEKCIVLCANCHRKEHYKLKCACNSSVS